ncbi:MAG: hypothetical protein IRY85_16655 [Micromonosporaceae bacterium]|nr:hypothetical protein [Micromonosporaceae bacterium]
MRWLRSLLVVGLLAGFGALLPSTPACACSCGALSAEEAVARADVVFVGVAVEVTVPWRGPLSSSGDPVTVTFDVSTVYKGDVPANARVRTVRDSATCGYPFVAGQRYLVHADRRTDGTWTTSLCDGNQPVDAATVLPAGGYSPGPAVAYPGEWPWGVLVAAALAAGALVVAGLLFRARRRRAAPPAS